MAVSKVILNGNTLMDTTQKTVTAASMLNGITALKNDGTDITGSIASKTSSDLTASGGTITAPAGYYASSASKAVSSGSATTPATTITANPTISVSSGGLITASVSASQSVTPSVSAGYVSSGTAGTVSVSGSKTQQLTAQAAQTITPTTTDQTIASGKYLTGTQTIKGDANLVAENIADGVTIFGVTGTHQGGGGGATLTASISTPSIAMGANVYYTDGDGTFHTDYVGEPMSPFQNGWYATLPVGTLVVVKNGKTALPASGTNIVKKTNIYNTSSQHIGAYVIEAT